MSELKIIKQLVPDTKFKNGKNNKKLYITIHTTDNTRIGANAQAHANLQSNGNSRDAAWHWQVDDTAAYQSFSHDFQLWQSGDGKGNGNSNSISIEICVNRDGNYTKAIENAAKLVRFIQDMERISTNNVVQHNKWSGKNCPSNLRAGQAGITWSKFIAMLGGQAPVVTPTAPSTKPVNTQYTGDSIVMYLQTLGIDSSFDSRAKLAVQYGVKGYTGTAQQNLFLLGQMRSGLPATPNKVVVPPAPKPVVPAKPVAPVVGQVVTLKKTATTYATGQTIATFAKGEKYKILQVKTDRVLLDKIMSWVRRTDIE